MGMERAPALAHVKAGKQRAATSSTPCHGPWPVDPPMSAAKSTVIVGSGECEASGAWQLLEKQGSQALAGRR